MKKNLNLNQDAVDAVDAVDAIKNYHAHLYYDAKNMPEAQQLAHMINQAYSVSIGTFHRKPIGPHPVWSCQITVTPDLLGEVIAYLLIHHGTIDVFIHANTDNHLLDHTQHVMWVGKSYALNLSIFES